MKLERKVRLCSAAAAVLIVAIALTGCGGSKSTASSAAASSVAASTAAATNNSCGEGVTWALADDTLTIRPYDQLHQGRSGSLGSSGRPDHHR